MRFWIGAQYLLFLLAAALGYGFVDVGGVIDITVFVLLIYAASRGAHGWYQTYLSHRRPPVQVVERELGRLRADLEARGFYSFGISAAELAVKLQQLQASLKVAAVLEAARQPAAPASTPQGAQEAPQWQSQSPIPNPLLCAHGQSSVWQCDGTHPAEPPAVVDDMLYLTDEDVDKMLYSAMITGRLSVTEVRREDRDGIIYLCVHYGRSRPLKEFYAQPRPVIERPGAR